MSYDISIFLPCIRVHNLYKFYESLLKSCKKYTFQIVIAGPFEPYDFFKNLVNFKFIKTYASPTKSAQLAALGCDSKLIYHTTDDVLFIEDSIDTALDYYHNLTSLDDNILSMRYIESANHSNKQSFPFHYWTVANSTPGIPIKQDFITNVHFLMIKRVFMEYGGFDCCFEYLTHAGADLLLRLQKDGYQVFHSPTDVTTADWYEGNTKDHEPISVAQTQHDLQLFYILWQHTGGSRGKIDYNNFKNYPDVWKRRFNGELPDSYSDLKLN